MVMRMIYDGWTEGGREGGMDWLYWPQIKLQSANLTDFFTMSSLFFFSQRTTKSPNSWSWMHWSFFDIVIYYYEYEFGIWSKWEIKLRHFSMQHKFKGEKKKKKKEIPSHKLCVSEYLQLIYFYQFSQRSHVAHQSVNLLFWLPKFKPHSLEIYWEIQI